MTTMVAKNESKTIQISTEVVKIFQTIIEREEKYIEERCMDLYYADSWEQAAQIRENISECDKKIETIKTFLANGIITPKMKDMLKREIRRRTAKYRSISI